MNNEYLFEKADYSFLPHFKKQTEKYPELKKYQSVIEESEALLQSTGNTKNKRSVFEKLLRNVMKIMNAYMNLSSVTSIIMLQPLYYLISRICSFALEVSEQNLAVNDLKTMKVQLEENMNNAKDKQTKNKFKKMIKEIDNTIYRLQNDDVEEHTRQRNEEENKKKDIKEMYNDPLILLNNEYLVEKADVQVKDLISPFTPNLCNKYPEMNKYKNVASECEEYFKSNDIKGTKGNVLLGKLNRLFNEMLTTSSDIGYIASILSANIPGIILTRIIKILSMNNEVDSSKQILMKNKQSLQACREKCKNSNEIKKIDQLIRKCDSAINDLENNTNEDHEKWALKRKQEKINAAEAKKAKAQEEKRRKLDNKVNKNKQSNKIKTNQEQRPINEFSFDCLMSDIVSL